MTQPDLNRPARILYVVNIPRFFVTHRLPLVLAAHQRGYDVHVATSTNDAEAVARIQATQLPFTPLPLAQHGTNPVSELGTLAFLVRLYRDLRPDLVHQVSIKPVLYGGLAARLTGIPAVVSAMSGLGYVFVDAGLKARLLRAGVQPLLRLALRSRRTQMIFQNPDDRARFVQLGLIAEARTTLIRGSGVDMDVFAPQPEPLDDLPRVLFAGRLMWSKGLGTFVKLAERLRGRARFIVAGYPEPTSPQAVPPEQLSAWRDAGLIEWWGRRDDMPQVFAAVNLVCLPSTYGEGVPKVLIEAAACGRAAVASDIPGCREIVHDGENGLLVAPGDLDALADAVVSLLDDPARRQQMGARGRQIAVDGFSLRQVLEETFALYDALLGV